MSITDAVVEVTTHLLNTTGYTSGYNTTGYNTTVPNTTENNFVFARYQTKQDFFAALQPAYLTIDRWITPIWLVIGCIVNPLSALVWLDRRLRRNNSSAIYLAALSICDFIFLLLYILFELTDTWGLTVYANEGWCETFHFFFYWPQYLSPILVLGFTIERFIAVCFPFHKEKFCTVQRAVIVIASMVTGTMLLSIMQPVSIGYQQEMHACAERDNMRDVMYIWSWVTEMLVFGVVPVCVLVFNTCVLLVIKRLSRATAMIQQGSSGNTTASTVTLLCVSFYLILTTLPVTAVYIIYSFIPMGNLNMSDAEIRSDPTWTQWFTFMTVRKLVEEICLSHYCLYFFIYFGTGPQFRATLKKRLYLHKLYRRRSSHNGQYKSVTTNGQSVTTTM